MNITPRKWLLPILIIIILILSAYVIVDSYNLLTQDKTCINQANGTGMGSGQGKALTQSYYLLITVVIIICLLIPIFYIVMTRNFKRHLEDKMKLITEIVDKNKKENKTQDVDKSSKTLILKFLDYGENQVIKKLIENNGTILQSEISRMPNIGKVRAHRIIVDLKKKEIITLENYGKTNRINLTEEAKNVLLK